MFGVLKTITTLLLVAATALAIDIQPLSNAQSGMPTTIRWTPVPSLETFTLYLVHTEFNDKFAIANNVNSSTGQLDVELPEVTPTSNYTLEFVSVGTNPEVYGKSDAFSIAPTPSTTARSASASGSTTASGVSVTGTMIIASSTMTAASESMMSSGSMAMSMMSSAASSAAASAKASSSASSAVRAVHDFTLGAIAGVVVIAFFSALRML